MTVDQDRLDTLARALAEPLPRRHAVRLLVAGIFGLAVGLRPRRAFADVAKGCGDSRLKYCPGGKMCGVDSLPDKVGNVGCHPFCCTGRHPTRNAVCCAQGLTPDGKAGVGWCCDKGFTCGSDDRAENKCRCSGTVDGSTGECSCPPDRACGDACCEPGQTCLRKGFPDERCVYLCENERSRGASQVYDPDTQCCTDGGIEDKHTGFNVTRCVKSRRSTLTPRAGFQPDTSAYGCGTTDKPLPEGFIPTEQGAKPVSWKAACVAHDACYDLCGVDRVKCDLVFRKALKKVCSRAYRTRKLQAARQACEEVMTTVADGVALLGGSAFDDAQRAACKCCP